MKQSPDIQKLENIMRSSRIVYGGFFGNDNRPLTQIIDKDISEVEKHGQTLKGIARRMKEITQLAKQNLGAPVQINDKIIATADESRGKLVCPWAEAGEYSKCVTTITNLNTKKVMRWSDLCIHLIEDHGFFQGKGSAFRIEPVELIKTIF